MTNADKLRQMTNIELAKFMYYQCSCTKGGINYVKVGKPYVTIKDTVAGWLEWLESESEVK